MMTYMINFQNVIQIQNQQQSFTEEAKKDMRKFLSTLTEGLESQLDPGFFQDDNDVQRKQKQQRNIVTKVKTRNLFANVSYRRYKPEDVEKTNFAIDVFSFLTQKLNRTGLDRKLETSLKKDYVKMVWDTCASHKLTKFIYLKYIFILF